MLFGAQEETLCFAKEAGGVRALECVKLISSISVKESFMRSALGFLMNACSKC